MNNIYDVISLVIFMENLGPRGAKCSFVVRAFAHGAMGCRIDSSWG